MLIEGRRGTSPLNGDKLWEENKAWRGKSWELNNGHSFLPPLLWGVYIAVEPNQWNARYRSMMPVLLSDGSCDQAISIELTFESCDLLSCEGCHWASSGISTLHDGWLLFHSDRSIDMVSLVRALCKYNQSTIVSATWFLIFLYISQTLALPLANQETTCSWLYADLYSCPTYQDHPLQDLPRAHAAVLVYVLVCPT